MIYYTFSNTEYDEYPVVILSAKPSKNFINQYMVAPYDIADQVITIKLEANEKGATAQDKRQYLNEELLPAIESMQANYIICTDGAYFKILTGAKKLDSVLGYVVPCSIKGYEHLHVAYCPSPQAVAFKPVIASEVIRVMESVLSHATGDYVEPGQTVIKYADYPKTVNDIRDWLVKLLEYPALSMDIEGWSLDVHETGIATITFCWSQHEGIAFTVDRDRDIKDARRIRALLIKFFKAYKGKAIWHNGTFDLSVIIYELFMDDLLDQEGLLEGLDIMCRNVDDTRLIAYLALNSTARPKLSLKVLSQEFLGDYAEEDIKNIDLIPTPKLLEYNLKDGLGTWFVHNKYYPKMVSDLQEDFYLNIFKPAITDIIQMQLTGVPVNMKQVKIVKKQMVKEYDKAYSDLRNSDIVRDYEEYRLNTFVTYKNNKYVKKRITTSDVKEEDYVFNPNSGKQLQTLLFDILKIEPIDYTKAKQPSTNAKSLKAIRDIVKDEAIKELITSLLDIAAVSTILSTFIPAMEKAKKAKDGMYYMFGNFNLGGTISGRLSSSNPNLQNLPSTGTKYAKLFKSCFMAPEGWLFVGLDFWSLEDRISALTTQDPNKIKVYIGESIYEVIVDGTCHHIRGDDTIIYDGKTYTGEEFHNAYTDGLL